MNYRLKLFHGMNILVILVFSFLEFGSIVENEILYGSLITSGIYILFGTSFGLISVWVFGHGMWIGLSVILYGVCCKNFAFDLQFKMLEKEEREKIVNKYFENQPDREEAAK